MIAWFTDEDIVSGIAFPAKDDNTVDDVLLDTRVVLNVQESL